MKKILSLMALMICVFACMDKVEYTEDDSSSLSGSTGAAVTGADAVAYVINQNILALHSIITASENNGFIVSAEEYTDNYGTGYRFILTTEDTVTLYGNSTTAKAEGTAPVIEAEKDQESGIYYWNLKGERLKDALGKDIPVSNPYISIRPIGTNWCYSVDGGVEWNIVSPIEALENPYTLEVAQRGEIHIGGMTYSPAWQPLFYYTMEEETSVASGFSVKVDYTIDASETPAPSIAVTDNGGWTVTATQPENGKGTVKITAPDEAKQGTTVTITFTDGSYNVAQEIEVLLKAPNAWEAIAKVGTDYSIFRDMVAAYNIINEEGEVTGNTYLDMYNADGASTWNMRMNEDASTTLLLPSNTVIETAIAEAAETLKNTLGREPNERDLKKFNDWILRACFFPAELTAAELSGSSDQNGISGYNIGGKEVEAALWRPSAQKLNGESKKLVNGNAFYLSKLHIPNYIVIYRIKSRPADSYYKDAATVTANTICYGGNIYCRQDNGQKSIFREGGWVMSDGMVWPEFKMEIFNIKPTQDALDNDLPIGFEMNAFILNDKNEVSLVKLPAGEYILSYGCAVKNSGQHYVISYAFGEGDYKEVATIAQKDYPLDRTSNGWAEYYRDYDTELKALDNANYLKLDCDGKVVGNIVISGNGFQQFKLKNISYDLSTIETSPTNYCEDLNATLHWCLRPTESVY